MKIKKILLLLTAFIFLFAMTSYADITFSSAWEQDAQGTWKAKYKDGSYVKNAWLCDDAVSANGLNVWYLLDPAGNMVSAGLVQDGTGNFYSLETNHDGYFGMLRYKSGNYNCNGQTVYLELESSHNGSFAAIKNQSAIDQLKAIYGLTSVANINNSNIVSTSTWIAKTGKSGGGPGAGGSSGGGGGGGSTGIGSSSSGGSSYGGSSGSSSGGGSSSGSDSGTSGKKDEKQEAIDEVIRNFKSEYITEGMSDFEKEMIIVQWMVENIDYNYTAYLANFIPQDCYTAYGALVNHLAVCDGYAHGFLELARACGLTVEYVSGKADNGTGNGYEGHAWNQILLDGKWYNLDVTWEDPAMFGTSPYGFGNIKCNYVNVTDEQLSKDHLWSGAHVCTATEYGTTVPLYYLETGNVDTSMKGDNWRDFVEENRLSNKYRLDLFGFKYDDDRNYSETAEKEKILSYATEQLEKGRSSFVFCVGEKIKSIDWLTDLWCKNNLHDGDINVSFTNGEVHLGYYTNQHYGTAIFNKPEDEPYKKPLGEEGIYESYLDKETNNVFSDRDALNAYVNKKTLELCEEYSFITADSARLGKPNLSFIRLSMDAGTYQIVKSSEWTTRKFAYHDVDYTAWTVKVEYIKPWEVYDEIFDEETNIFVEEKNKDGLSIEEYIDLVIVDKPPVIYIMTLGEEQNKDDYIKGKEGVSGVQSFAGNFFYPPDLTYYTDFYSVHYRSE